MLSEGLHKSFAGSSFKAVDTGTDVKTKCELFTDLVA